MGGMMGGGGGGMSQEAAEAQKAKVRHGKGREKGERRGGCVHPGKVAICMSII